jgi:WD40 repeat protein
VLGRLKGQLLGVLAMLAVRPGESATFSPEGNRIVTASDDCTVRIWGRPHRRADRHTARVHSAAFSPQGDRIVTASNDRTTRICDARTGTQIATLQGHENWVESAAFSPQGDRIVTTSHDRTVRILFSWGRAGDGAASDLGHHGGRLRPGVRRCRARPGSWKAPRSRRRMGRPLERTSPFAAFGAWDETCPAGKKHAKV